MFSYKIGCAAVSLSLLLSLSRFRPAGTFLGSLPLWSSGPSLKSGGLVYTSYPIIAPRRRPSQLGRLHQSRQTQCLRPRWCQRPDPCPHGRRCLRALRCQSPFKPPRPARSPRQLHPPRHPPQPLPEGPSDGEGVPVWLMVVIVAGAVFAIGGIGVYAYANNRRRLARIRGGN